MIQIINLFLNTTQPLLNHVQPVIKCKPYLDCFSNTVKPSHAKKMCKKVNALVTWLLPVHQLQSSH